MQEATDLLWLAIIASAMTVLTVSFLLSRKVVTPITTLTRQLTNYQIGMRFEGLLLKRRDEIGDLDRGIARMDARIKRLFRSLKTKTGELVKHSGTPFPGAQRRKSAQYSSAGLVTHIHGNHV